MTRMSNDIVGHPFRRELVPQNPLDEPASELLARICTTREANASKKPHEQSTRCNDARTS